MTAAQPVLRAVASAEAGPRPVDRLSAHVAATLEAEGAAWPGFGAACLAARGMAGQLDAGAWAAVVGLAPERLDLAERGLLAPAGAPAVLVALADAAWEAWRRW